MPENRCSDKALSLLDESRLLNSRAHLKSKERGNPALVCCNPFRIGRARSSPHPQPRGRYGGTGPGPVPKGEYLFSVAQSSSSAVSQTFSLLTVGCGWRLGCGKAQLAFGGLPSATRGPAPKTFGVRQTECLTECLRYILGAKHIPCRPVSLRIAQVAPAKGLSTLNFARLTDA
jgi:hypothetical protein